MQIIINPLFIKIYYTMHTFNTQELELLPEFESIFNNEFEGLYSELEEMPINVSRTSKTYIKWVQGSLNKILGLKLVVNGDNDSNTSSAIKSFQAKNGLETVGYVGPKTEAALIKANTLIASAGTTISATPTPTTTSSTCKSARALPTTMGSLLAAVDDMLKKIPLLGYSGIVIPKKARFLDCNEETIANSVFGNSLDYSRIIITDGLGFSGRPFTVAIPIAGKFFVVMMLGASPSHGTLIHELTHAWQSQHHGTNPIAFMWAAVKCQLMALADIPLAKSTAATIAYSKIIPSLFSTDIIAIARATKASLDAAANEDCSAYAYIPGYKFENYGAEQIAQQVEDHFIAKNAGKKINDQIVNIISSTTINTSNQANEKSLTIVGYNRKSALNVVWH